MTPAEVEALVAAASNIESVASEVPLQTLRDRREDMRWGVVCEAELVVEKGATVLRLQALADAIDKQRAADAAFSAALDARIAARRRAAESAREVVGPPI